MQHLLTCNYVISEGGRLRDQNPGSIEWCRPSVVASSVSGRIVWVMYPEAEVILGVGVRPMLHKRTWLSLSPRAAQTQTARVLPTMNFLQPPCESLLSAFISMKLPLYRVPCPNGSDTPIRTQPTLHSLLRSRIPGRAEDTLQRGTRSSDILFTRL